MLGEQGVEFDGPHGLRHPVVGPARVVLGVLPLLLLLSTLETCARQHEVPELLLLLLQLLVIVVSLQL